jgi:hypothetical protein
MSQAAEILTEIRRRGMTIALDGDDLRLRPRRALDEDLKTRILAQKPAIIEVLRLTKVVENARPVACGPKCYQAEPGKWIHRPWAGCTTIKKDPAKTRQVKPVCWHCSGARRCKCAACGKLALSSQRVVGREPGGLARNYEKTPRQFGPATRARRPGGADPV